MPELPEVETVVRQLKPALCGRQIRAVRILDPLLRTLQTNDLPGREIIDVARSGKEIILTLSFPTTRQHRSPSRQDDQSAATLWLAIHLRMTGRLTWEPRVGRSVRRPRLRALITFDEGALCFYDLRRFGTITRIEDERRLVPPGQDPLSPTFRSREMWQLLRRSNQELKVWLLRQDRLCGLGNIYVCEILHRARLDPWIPTSDLTLEHARKLHRVTRQILRKAIQNCGTTFSDFQDAHGLTGRYQHFLVVYNREGEPCPTCGTTIQRCKQHGRSTFFCPRCQAVSQTPLH